MLILRNFRKDDYCARLLKAQIMSMENGEGALGSQESKTRFLELCREYFIETLSRSKDPEFIKNELEIIKSGEIRSVFEFLLGNWVYSINSK